MTSEKTLYGLLALAVAALVLTSSIGIFYYTSFQEANAADLKHQSEIVTALTSYNSLLSSFNESLVGYNETISLLVNTTAGLDTRSPAYARVSSALADVWLRYNSLVAKQGARADYSVNILVEGTDGARHWHNGTAIQPGWNMYVATLVLFEGKVGAVWYPQYGEHFVNSIGGFNSTQTSSWFVWVHKGNGWEFQPTGADEVRLFNGSMVAWTLCGYDNDYNPTCAP